jgi:hypothetical protein
MKRDDDAVEQTHSRRRLQLLLIVIGGTVVGALAALRFIDRAGGGQRIPSEGLVYFGALFTVGGLLYLIPGFWKWQTRRSTWSGKTVFGKMPARESLPTWRRALWDLQGWLVAGDERRNEAIRRDPRPHQLRASAVTLSLGLTILLYAALR